MKAYNCNDIKNVCVLGHGGAGKTSLTEAMLYLGEGTDRLGKVADGNTVSDYDAEEVKRKISINLTVNPLEWKNRKINILDAPGFFDFEGEAHQALRIAASTLIVVSAKSGVNAGTEFAWNYTNERKIPKIIFISKMDADTADYNKVLAQLKDTFGNSIAPFYVPIIEDDKFKGYVNVVKMQGRIFVDGKIQDVPVPDSMIEEIQPARQMIMEAVAETSEDLMNKFFDGEEFTEEEITKAVKQGVADLSITPVICGSAFTSASIRKLLDAIIEYMPSPNEIGPQIGVKPDGSEIAVECTETDPFSAYVFKTISDPFVGKLSFVKVYSGVLKADSTLYNANKQITEKIGKISFMRGKKLIDTPEITYGDLGVIPKLTKTETGDTLCSQSNPFTFAPIDFPKPCMTLAIAPKEKGDEEKISSGLAKIREEDKTLAVEINKETHQTLLSGLGDLQLEVVLSKLKEKYKVDAVLSAPRIAYRETVRRRVEVEGKHKKQSGGHGQYGHVKIAFEPWETEELVFAEQVVGGSVPKNYFPAVEKGLKESCLTGVLAGYPVVGLKATLLDGSYHPVDSSEMAFKVAANLAFKAGMPQAIPVLLEPIDTVEITAPDRYTGDIISDVNKRRGRVMCMNPDGKGNQVISAEIPAAELAKYATDLKSMTQSRGRYVHEFIRYEEAPANIVEKVVADSKKDE